MNSYQRNGTPEASLWKTTQDEFRGYVRAKLEDLEEIQESQWETHKETKRRIVKLETKTQYAIGGLVVVNVAIVTFIAAYNAGMINF